MDFAIVIFRPLGNAYVRRGNAMSGITLEVAKIQNYTHVPEFLAALSVHMFFITGSPSKISRVLDGVAHSSRNMFSDRNSLWTFSTVSVNYYKTCLVIFHCIFMAGNQWENSNPQRSPADYGPLPRN